VGGGGGGGGGGAKHFNMRRPLYRWKSPTAFLFKKFFE